MSCNLNEHEKNLLWIMSRLCNNMMCGYSYRPNWNTDYDKELFRDKDLKKFMQNSEFQEMINKIDLTECNTELLECCGFMKLDEEHTKKGLRCMPLWYYEAINNGETKEKKLDTDIRFGCVIHSIKIVK